MKRDEFSNPLAELLPFASVIVKAGGGGGGGSGDGRDGVGILSLTQTTTSTDDHGANIWTATLTNGRRYMFQVLNGSQGSAGAPGADGAAATIQIGTVSAGDVPMVSNSGTSSAAVFNFTLPRGPQGIQGETGADGRSFTILTMYATEAELRAAHPTGEAGDAYIVGTAENNVVYIWDSIADDWLNIGPIRGVKGDTGDDGYTPTITAASVSGGVQLTITNATGTQTVTILNGTNGTDGTNGTNGTDGHSVTVSSVPDSGGVTITFSDAVTGTVLDTVYIANGTGGLDPVSKTDAMTQSVGRDLDGKLWTAPGGGGGGGTTDYDDLTNKPSIGGVELSGNKTLAQIGAVPAASVGVAGGVAAYDATQTALAGKQNSLTFDNAPTAGSDNPVKSGGVKSALDGKQDALTFDNAPTANSDNPVKSGGIKSALDGKVDTSSVGTSGGVAELDATGKVPSSQLPSYVDDVVDGYYNDQDGKFYEESTYTTEITGEGGKIYVSVDTSIQYRWTGSAFSALGGALVLGETSSTAYRGDRGKIAYDDSQANKAAIGDLSQLETTEKGELVGAVNEAATTAQALSAAELAEVEAAFQVENPVPVYTHANPTGTIITLMGKTAPDGYLVCDGTVYQISAYPVLAAYFAQQFETANFFGGDGTTTFAVPDLRGEFLRGTGTNGHESQGSGANVGVHQDGTEQSSAMIDNSGRVMFSVSSDHTNGFGVQSNEDNPTQTILSANHDYSVANVQICYRNAAGGMNTNLPVTKGAFTSRPTNTSVLYCIKY